MAASKLLPQYGHADFFDGQGRFTHIRQLFQEDTLDMEILQELDSSPALVFRDFTARLVTKVGEWAVRRHSRNQRAARALRITNNVRR